MLIRIVFVALAALGLLAALGTVLARNLVRAALFLVSFFFVVACQFILLEAEFMAAMQVLVYIGAVAILIMFGIMLTRNIQGDDTTRASLLSRALAGLVSLGVLAVLVVGILSDRGAPGRPAWAASPARPPAARLGEPTTDPRSAAINDMTRVVGIELMTRFAVPFEIAGLLLTAALVGAVALSLGHHDEDEPAGPGRVAAAARGASPTTGNGHPVGPPSPADAPSPTASAPR